MHVFSMCEVLGSIPITSLPPPDPITIFIGYYVLDYTLISKHFKYIISETGTTNRSLCCRSKKPNVHAILLKENWPLINSIFCTIKFHNKIGNANYKSSLIIKQNIN